MLYTITTRADFAAVCSKLEKAISEHKYGLLHVHDLRKTMADKGVEFEPECKIFELCNPHRAKQVLDVSLEVSTALPCRISVYVKDGMTYLSTLKPSMMISMFDLPELKDVADSVEDSIVAIIQDAAKV